MNQNKKIISFSIILNLSALVVIFLIIYPLYNEIRIESENLISEKTITYQAIEKNKSLKNAERQYDNYEKNSEKFESLFISSETPINFIEFLENTAQNFNLSMKITPQSFEKQKNGLWTFMNLDVNLIGSFSNLSKFIEKLEYSCFPDANQEKGYLVEINNLRLKSLSEEDIQTKRFETSKTGDVDAHFSIKVTTK
jgi:hypothetical protein